MSAMKSVEFVALVGRVVLFVIEAEKVDVALIGTVEKDVIGMMV